MAREFPVFSGKVKHASPLWQKKVLAIYREGGIYYSPDIILTVYRINLPTGKGMTSFPNREHVIQAYGGKNSKDHV